MLKAGMDTLVLGCTHYPFLIESIRRLTGPNVTIMEPGPAVAAQAARRLEAAGLLRSGALGKETFFINGAEAVLPVLNKLWHPAREEPIEELTI